MDYFNEYVEKMTLQEIGSIASIAGVAISCYVLWSLKVIKGFYGFTARVPVLLNKLNKHNSNVSNYLNDFEGSIQSIKEELTKAEIVLSSIKRKVGSPTKRSVRSALKLIETYNKNPEDEEQLRSAYVEMVKVAELIKDRQADLKWER